MLWWPWAVVPPAQGVMAAGLRVPLPQLLLLLLLAAHAAPSPWGFLNQIPRSSFIYSLHTSLSDEVLVSLSHTVVFPANKIKSFLIPYFVEAFDYRKRPRNKAEWLFLMQACEKKEF